MPANHLPVYAINLRTRLLPKRAREGVVMLFKASSSGLVTDASQFIAGTDRPVESGFTHFIIWPRHLRRRAQ